MQRKRRTQRERSLPAIRARLRRFFLEGIGDPQPIRVARMVSPLVRSLEPRFVLNGTAILDPLIDLSVMGASTVGTVQLQAEPIGGLSLDATDVQGTTADLPTGLNSDAVSDFPSFFQILVGELTRYQSIFRPCATDRENRRGVQISAASKGPVSAPGGG